MNKQTHKGKITAAALASCLIVSTGASSILLASPPPKKTGKTATPATAKATTPVTPKATVAALVGDNTPLTDDQKILHVLNRMGFGPRPGDLENVRRMGLDQYIALQLQPENIDDSVVEEKLVDLTALKASSSDLAEQYVDGQRLNRDMNRFLAAAKKEQDAKLAANTPGGTLTVDETMQGGNTPADTKMTDNKMPVGKMPDTKMAAPDTAETLGLSKQDIRRQIYDRMTLEEKQGFNTLLEQRQAMQRNGGAPALQLMAAKIIRAIDSPRQMQEVLADFWNNHFNVDVRKNECRVFKIADDRDVIRPHMLGKFRDLLGADAKSPAMLVYLDNYQSSVPRPVNPRANQRPRMVLRNANGVIVPQTGGNVNVIPPVVRGGINENYAREIMELHTLGVDGGYTQKDVTEVARCLTGWGIRRQTGEFFFDSRRHDDGEKIVLGHRIPAGGGIQDGETVLDILASHPSTMRFISTKLCKRFVSDTPPVTLVNRCVQTWQRTDGNLREVVRTIVTSPEFFSRAAYRQKIKSPFEYAISSVRALGGTIKIDEEPIQLGRLNKGNTVPTRLAQSLIGQISIMGEPLFQCQPPTGYSEDSHKWVSTGALISRLNFSLMLTSGRMPNLDISAAHNLVPGNASPQAEVNDLATALLHGEVTPSTRATLLRQVTVPVAPGEEKIGTRRVAALVLGSPEFQRR